MPFSNEATMTKPPPPTLSWAFGARNLRLRPHFLDALMWVKADYQEQQQQAWLTQLRQKYAVEVNEALLEETIK